MYLIVLGVYDYVENGIKMQSDLDSLGIKTFPMWVDGKYYICYGKCAFSVKQNADLTLYLLRQVGFDCFIKVV